MLTHYSHGKEADLEREVNENVSSFRRPLWIATDSNRAQIKSNLLSNVYLVNTFLDLIRKGKEKKIVFVSSPSGDLEFTRITGIPFVVGYSIAKAGMNMVMTKFATELAPEDIHHQ